MGDRFFWSIFLEVWVLGLVEVYFCYKYLGLKVELVKCFESVGLSSGR